MASAAILTECVASASERRVEHGYFPDVPTILGYQERRMTSSYTNQRSQRCVLLRPAGFQATGLPKPSCSVDPNGRGPLRTGIWRRHALQRARLGS